MSLAHGRPYLAIPGPSVIPDRVLRAMHQGSPNIYDGPLIEDTYHSNANDYVASMERLLELPVRIVHGGHYPSYAGARHQQMIGDWLKGKRA